jgi:hypothetical protein
MPFTWTMTIDQSTDWSHKDFVDMFVQKIALRWAVLRDVGTMPASVAAGDDVQSANDGHWPAVGPTWPTTSPVEWSWRRMQKAVAIDLAPSYYSPDALTFPVDTGGAEPFTYLSTTYTYDIASIAVDANLNGTHNDHFRRKKPRQISSTAATADTDANTVADGMVAELATNGLKYKRISGAWVRDESLPFDTLDSANPGGGGSYCAPGYMAPGDYLGPWIFNELRAAINLLYITFGPPDGFGGCEEGVSSYKQHYTALGGDNETFGAITDDADAAWALGAAFASGSGSNFIGGVKNELYHWAWAKVSPFPGVLTTRLATGPTTASGGGLVRDSVELYGEEFLPKIDDRTMLAGIDADVTLVVYGDDPGLPPGVGTAQVYDDAGYGAIRHKWDQVETLAITSKVPSDPASPVYFAKFGDWTVHPTYPGSAPSVPTNYGAVFNFGVFYRWAFDTYTPTADDALPVEEDCPTTICLYRVRATPVCPGADPTKADYTVTQEEKVCDYLIPAGSSVGFTPTPVGTTGDGLTIYEMWVTGADCPGGTSDCANLTTAALDDLRAEFPVQDCPLTPTCHKRITYVSEWSCEFATWNGEEGDQIPEYVNGSGTCADSDAPAPHDWEVTSFGDTGNPIATKEEDIGICDCDDAGSHYDPTFTEIADNRPSDPPFSGADLCPE